MIELSQTNTNRFLIRIENLNSRLIHNPSTFPEKQTRETIKVYKEILNNPNTSILYTNHKFYWIRDCVKDVIQGNDIQGNDIQGNDI